MGTPVGRGGGVPSGNGVFGVNDVSEESINHGTRECKEEESEETEEKDRVEHLTAAGACCHMTTAEDRGARWRRMSTTHISAR